MTTLNFGNANQTIAAGSNETIIVGDGNDNIAIGSNDNLTVGDGNDKVTTTGDANDIITVGNGNDTVTVGANSTVTAGNGSDTVTAGAGSTVTVGSGHDTVTVGANSTVTAGNGGDTVTAGAGSTVTVGNGGDTVIVGSNSSVTTGNGSDTVVFAGSNDTATIGTGNDTVVFQPSATPTLAAPATLSVNEDGTIALPISTGLSAASFGHDTIYGFAAASDHLEFTTAQFANFATLMADAKQVGQDTVITSAPPDTITLKGVALSSLVAKDFVFVNGSGGSGGNLSVTISGLPSDASLSDSSGPLTVTNGSITLTPVQLAGLTLQAGESSAMLTVTATNTTTGDSVSQTIALTVNPVAEAPSLAGTATSITVNEGATIALPISMTPKDGDDTISITVTGVPTDATLSAGTPNGGGSWTLTPAQLANLQLFAGEDTTATLTVTGTNSEGPGASTSQNITLTVSPVAEAPSLAGTATSMAVSEGGTVGLPITMTPKDGDDTVAIAVTGVPTDTILSAGTNNGGGNWSLTPAQLAGLQITAGEDTTATLTVTGTNSEGPGASTSQNITLTVSPVVEAPSLAGTATSMAVSEGGTVGLPITMTPKDGDDTVAITVTGVPTDASLSAGTNNGGGNWTLTAAQLAGLQITAGEDTTATLTVTATNSEGLGAATSQTISLTVSPVPEVPSLSAPSSLTTTVNGSVALPIGVTPQDADDVLSVTISGIPSDATLSDNSGPLTVTSGSVTLTPAQLAGLTLHAGATPATLTVTATNSESTSASARQDVFLTLSSGSANLWAASKIPAQTIPGDHIYAPALQINASLNFEGILYGETTANYSVPGPDVVTDKLLTLDPFLLAENGGSQALETSTIYKFPFRYQFILPNVTSTQAEGIAVYETQDQSGNRFLNQVFVTRNGASAPLTVGTPTQIETLTAPEENPIFVSFRNNSSGTLASYDVAWDQFNGSAQTYTINFQIFNPNGSTSSPVETPVSLTGVTGGVTALPGWFFRSGFGAYALAYAKPSTTVIGQQVVQFQGYNTDGTPNATSFAINPDLSHYAAGATNQITLEQNPRTHTLVTSPLKFAQFSNNEAAIAWNETVTDTNGTHDQVEFVIFKPGQGVVSRTTFQISDGLPQEINLQIRNDVAVLEYGDDTATNIVEFDSNGLQLGAATESTTQTAQSLIDFGDGRVGIVYDYLVDSSGTSQLVTHVYDFRTIGVNINDSTLVDGLDKYVAGTKFNDTFVGENNVNNTYDFIGQNTGGPAPSDSFTGGSNGWNVAILPDAESNYSITTANGTTTLTNTGDPPHAGTLAVTNVQALAFNPAADPSGNPGTLQATGDRLDILGPLPGGGEPITIGTGSTLELNTPDNGPVTFAGPTGTLQLHVSSSLTGQISGFGAQDGIDLADVSFGASTTLGYTPNNSNTGGVLAVSDGTHTANLALLGNYMASSFVIASDGHGGTLLTDPPPTSLQQPFLTQPYHA